MPPTTTLELDEYVEVWTEVLFGVVPVEQLNSCYLAAIQRTDRKPEEKQFPLKVTELLDAFYKQRAASTPIKITECEFCRMHRYDSTSWPLCPFHRVYKQHTTFVNNTKDLKPLGSIFNTQSSKTRIDDRLK